MVVYFSPAPKAQTARFDKPNWSIHVGDVWGAAWCYQGEGPHWGTVQTHLWRFSRDFAARSGPDLWKIANLQRFCVHFSFLWYFINLICLSSYFFFFFSLFRQECDRVEWWELFWHSENEIMRVTFLHQIEIESTTKIWTSTFVIYSSLSLVLPRN